MNKEYKIIGLHSGHDCSYCVLEDGIPVIHNELERFTRKKEHLGDAFEFLTQTYDGFKDVKYYGQVVDRWKGGYSHRYPKSNETLNNIIKDNNGETYFFGHHYIHSANAFYSSNFDEALIVTLDAGGWDFSDDTLFTNENPKENVMVTTFTVSHGVGNSIERLQIMDINDFSIGGTWNKFLEDVFNLSTGYPYGNQAGTVMAMACMGDGSKYLDYLGDIAHLPKRIDTSRFRDIVNKGDETDKFEISSAVQVSTEQKVREYLQPYIDEYKPKNLCLAGGVALNSVMIGKMYEWYDGIVDNIYIPPVPYDAGLAIGSCQIIWHHEEFMNQPRVTWKDSSPTYLGYTYHEDSIFEELEKSKDKVSFEEVDDYQVVDLLCKNDNVISVYGCGSESGRRALGNRSILADPRSPEMKDIINEKVKHRQWFRPFAPSVLRDDVEEWFEIDVDSPYMTTVIKFKEDKRDKVPAVVHFDGSARLQTVTENDNEWYYNFIKKFKEKTGVPIVLNTSFNDREPIVETPAHAIDCFLRTNIDYLYFRDYGILVSKNV
tara:strand:- start:1741 stop:3378 length:1638 start_codon:yes stop_codon:yes gene_type:complete